MAPKVPFQIETRAARRRREESEAPDTRAARQRRDEAEAHIQALREGRTTTNPLKPPGKEPRKSSNRVSKALPKEKQPNSKEKQQSRKKQHIAAPEAHQPTAKQPNSPHTPSPLAAECTAQESAFEESLVLPRRDMGSVDLEDGDVTPYPDMNLYENDALNQTLPKGPPGSGNQEEEEDCPLSDSFLSDLIPASSELDAE